MTVYCIVPRELAGRLEERLCEHYASEPQVVVVVERRTCERRRRATRRAAFRDGGGHGPPVSERRAVRSEQGRRVGERRVPVVTVSVESPKLPRRLARYADLLAFVERVAPSERDREDLQANQLIARFQSGEAAAFAELYRLYFDRLYGYMKAGLRNSHEAEDRVQQVFTQVFTALPRYEIEAARPFRGWLFRIARNDLLKTLERQRKISVADPDWLDRQRDTDDEDALESTLRWLSDGELFMFVERLPIMQRQTLVLRYMLGLDTGEIAGVLGSSVENVRQLEHRALRFLEQRLTAIGRAPTRSHRAATVVMLRQAPVLRMRRFALH